MEASHGEPVDVFRDRYLAVIDSAPWCRESLYGNGIVLDYGVMRHFADAEALYSSEGTREMNTLIVGRAITGTSAFV